MILITGSKGQLGQELTQIFNFENIDYIGVDIDEMDITKIGSIRELVKTKEINIIINCAAYTAVDKAEEDEKMAYAINETGVKNLIEVAQEIGAFLVHLSTDFIFDRLTGDKTGLNPWKTTDIPKSNSVYGASKLAGENRLHEKTKQGENLVGATLIRTSWVYSQFGNNFPKTMLRLAREHGRLSVVEDQIGRPTWAGRLADFIYVLLSKLEEDLSKVSSKSASEIYNLSNSGVASWYDFAKATIEFGVEMGLVENIPVLPVATEEFKRPAPRPHYSVLDLSQARGLYGPIPHWEDDLKTFLMQLKD